MAWGGVGGERRRGRQTWKDTHHYRNLCGMTLEVGLGGRQMHFDHRRTKKDNTTVKWEEPTRKTQTLSGRTSTALAKPANRTPATRC